ncbi:MAG: 30S ribosome-binding factor RbfA [Chloroflexi bacterium]|nr:30S ribosome-binding factor RbfA [Chloroflexota bacterium]MBU1747035.1 30S ribosome-binding factor RbfA [Chloroflexota bacterium]
MAQRGNVKQERIGALIRNHISYLFERDEVRDPRLNFVSVTDVEVTQDQRFAKVFVRVLGSPEEQQEALAALERAAGFIRTKLAGRLRLRHMPELSFHLDQALEYGNRIDALLDEIGRTEPAGESTDA